MIYDQKMQNIKLVFGKSMDKAEGISFEKAKINLMREQIAEVRKKREELEKSRDYGSKVDVISSVNLNGVKN